MAERTRGMGRGLAAILSHAPRRSGEAELRELPVDLIAPNPHQPRRSFDEDALVALADSLKERGVLQPVLVRPVPGGTYELIAGERRWRAAQLAGLDTVPAIVRPDDDAASLELALIENMAREDLNPLEEARACAALVEELGLTREEVGRRVGRSRVAVSNLLRLLDLPDEALDADRGRLAVGGPRPRAADGARPRRAPPPGARAPTHRAGRSARPRTRARAAAGRDEAEHRGEPRATRAASRPGRGGGAPRRGLRPGARRRRARDAEGRAATGSSSPSSRSTRRSRWPSGWGSTATA